MTKPPGHTCPAIDKAQSAMRKLAWRCRHPQHESRVTVDDLIDGGLAALEQVREENRQMRAAYWGMRERYLTAAGLSVTETPVAPVRDEQSAHSSLCSRCGHATWRHAVVHVGQAYQASGDQEIPATFEDCYECSLDQGICMPMQKYT